MIKLATVFSGIGAIEHALKRMNIDTEIVFACDSGDIDILSKKIDNSFTHIYQEIDELANIISKTNVSNEEDLDYKSTLEDDLLAIRRKLDKSERKIDEINIDRLHLSTILICNQIIEMPLINNKKRKEYIQCLKDIESDSNERFIKYVCLKTILKIQDDFRKDNTECSIEDEDSIYSSRDGIDWNLLKDAIRFNHGLLEDYHVKKIVKGMKEVAERLSMLHERIETLAILVELKNISEYEKKKQYVDTLYNGRIKSNAVRASYFANYDIDDSRFHWNVSFLDGKQYRDKVDLFVGGSPCQSFSLVGKQRGLEDTRGTLFYEYARLVKEIQPKVFIYENVKAVLSNDNGKTWETMAKAFDELDYSWTKAILNAKDYGVPQNRERVFVVGIRKDLKTLKDFAFPAPLPLDKSMSDLLIENASGKYYLPQKGVDFVTDSKNINKRYTQIDGEVQLCQKKNQQFNWHGDFVFEDEESAKAKRIEELEKYFLSEKVTKYVLSSGTKNFYSRPKIDLDIARPLLTTMHKMHRAGVDNYVTTDGRIRKLTPRECLRLMGFCDSFEIVVSDTSMYQQAGNSIVVDVLISICKEIFQCYPNLLE
jgi:DNA (cytosine-5)-methyltransferase 1